MFCQLDQVKQILDITAAVKETFSGQWAGPPDMAGYSLRAASVICGLLVLYDYDVFMKQGAGHYWVELYLDGAEFVIIVAGPGEDGPKKPDIAFMPAEDAPPRYGLATGKDYQWRRDDCEEYVWQAVLEKIGIKKTVREVLDEIESIW